jgi:hypothetical protein
MLTLGLILEEIAPRESPQVLRALVIVSSRVNALSSLSSVVGPLLYPYLLSKEHQPVPWLSMPLTNWWFSNVYCLDSAPSHIHPPFIMTCLTSNVSGHLLLNMPSNELVTLPSTLPLFSALPPQWMTPLLLH